LSAVQQSRVPARERVTRILGSTKTLFVCAAVVLWSWATVDRTDVTRTPLVKVGGFEVSLPRFPSGRAKPSGVVPTKTLLLVPDKARAYEAVEASGTSERLGAWLDDPAPTYDVYYLSLFRVIHRSGAWAPLSERVTLSAKCSPFRYHDPPLASEVAVDCTTLMEAVPARERAGFAPLWPAAGRPLRSAQYERTLFLGYAWNAMTLAGVLGIATWPFCTPSAMQRRAEARRRRGECVRCRYQLRTDSGALTTCPECGEEN
jgi:hypothetical protein